MRLETLQNLHGFLTSDRVTIKGSEYGLFTQLLQEIGQEMAMQVSNQQNQQRIRPVPNPPDKDVG